MSHVLDDQKITEFQTLIMNYYQLSGRHHLPWRLPEPDGSFNPYKIMVSEIMLQQTQVARVITKYQQFLSAFPSVEELAVKPLAEVLQVWLGLGYNRRAKYLHQSAQAITTIHNGVFPQTVEQLVTLPGIGANTAGAIAAYSFNQPVVFIETNIRTVYLHHFFKDQPLISDKEIRPYIQVTLDTTNPRQWYWALMDYGTFLKSTINNPNRLSKHYSRQSVFKGSKRQVRGEVLRYLARQPGTLKELQTYIADERLVAVVAELESEGLINHIAGHYALGK